MNYMNQKFENKRIDLHGNSYHQCVFKNCELIYDGDRSPTFFDNEFVDSVFIFTGSALRTLYFLSNMYQSGEGGKQVVDKTIDDLKHRRIHGHQVRMPQPSTPDHRLTDLVLQ